MFLIPNLLPSNERLKKILVPEIRASSEEMVDFDDNFLDDQKARLTSQVSLQSFADKLGVNRSHLLLDKTNLNSRPNSFILFSIVPAGSFRDLSISSERYSNSREASYTSLARLSEIKVDSRTNSCAKLETVEEAEISDASASSEVLDVIIEPSNETKLRTALSHDNINGSTNEERVGEVIVNLDAIIRESVPSIVVSNSTESGFISEDCDARACSENDDIKELVSSTSDLDEKRLSGYSWNSTGSDISWKTQYSEADTEDSGYAEEITPGAKEEIVKYDGSTDTTDTYLTEAILKSDSVQQSSYCSCDSTLDTKDNRNELSGCEDNGEEHAHSLKESPLIIDPGPLDYYSELLERQLESQSHCAWGENESVLSGKGIIDVKETIQRSDTLIAAFLSPPDIYSELFEGILEEVNEYAESFSEMYNGCHDSLKTWAKVSVTDLNSCERETVV